MAKRRKSTGKNPWIAAILNIIIAGLGYIYVGRRKNFGYLLIIGQVLILANIMVNPTAQNTAIEPLVIIGGILWELAFAYDGFRMAQGRE